MKRAFTTVLAFAFACLAYSQSPFNVYTPVIIDSKGNVITESVIGNQKQQNSNSQTIYAYYVKNNNFQKIRIRVNVVSSALGEQVWVKGYQDKNLGHWFNTNTRADEVTRNDAPVIQQNFEYKCYILNLGYIYF